MQKIKDLVYEVLRKAKEPLQVSEITKRVQKIRPINSKTPYNTINAACQRHEKIKKVARATFQVIK